jgi:hypothetical protein
MYTSVVFNLFFCFSLSLSLLLVSLFFLSPCSLSLSLSLSLCTLCCVVGGRDHGRICSATVGRVCVKLVRLGSPAPPENSFRTPCTLTLLRRTPTALNHSIVQTTNISIQLSRYHQARATHRKHTTGASTVRGERQGLVRQQHRTTAAEIHFANAVHPYHAGGLYRVSQQHSHQQK